MYKHVIYERFMIVIFHKLHTEARGGTDHSTRKLIPFPAQFPLHWFPKTFWTKMRWLRCEKKRVVLKYFLRSLEGVWVWYSEPKYVSPKSHVLHCFTVWSSSAWNWQSHTTFIHPHSILTKCLALYIHLTIKNDPQNPRTIMFIVTSLPRFLSKFSIRKTFPPSQLDQSWPNNFGGQSPACPSHPANVFSQTAGITLGFLRPLAQRSWEGLETHN